MLSEEREADGARGVAAWIERALVGALLLLVACAPHTIAGTQAAWGLGLLLWLARIIVRPRARLWRTPVDYALLGFFVLTFVSSLFSYDPEVSIGKLRAASLFTIVYLVAENVRSRRVARALALLLVASCMLNVVYTFGAWARGRGVKLEELSAESPLRRAGAREGDTLLEVDGARVREPSEVERAILEPHRVGEVTVRWPGGEASCVTTVREACVRGYRAEVEPPFPVVRAELLQGATPEARLGITRWTHGRDERATGFYGQYVTYAEVLQLIGSLALGLLVAQPRKWSVRAALLASAVAGMTLALMLTVTRASWLGFLLSAFTIVAAGAGGALRRRRTLLLAACVAVPLVVAGLLVLQQKRRVGFIDTRDGSTTWRLTVWREGARMLVEKPRHLVVGVGMDSLKAHWREWGMFDRGRIPWGHLHSTPLQFAFERGVPSLLCWLALVWLYARMLWRMTRRGDALQWVERGVALGALGGLVGFFTSGLVHYNFGDSEVVMVFYLIMGLALALDRLTRDAAETERAPTT